MTPDQYRVERKVKQLERLKEFRDDMRLVLNDLDIFSLNKTYCISMQRGAVISACECELETYLALYGWKVEYLTGGYDNQLTFIIAPKV